MRMHTVWKRQLQSASALKWSTHWLNALHSGLREHQLAALDIPRFGIIALSWRPGGNSICPVQLKASERNICGWRCRAGRGRHLRVHHV